MPESWGRSDETFPMGGRFIVLGEREEWPVKKLLGGGKNTL